MYSKSVYCLSSAMLRQTVFQASDSPQTIFLKHSKKYEITWQFVCPPVAIHTRQDTPKCLLTSDSIDTDHVIIFKFKLFDKFISSVW